MRVPVSFEYGETFETGVSPEAVDSPRAKKKGFRRVSKIITLVPRDQPEKMKFFISALLLSSLINIGESILMIENQRTGKIPDR